MHTHTPHSMRDAMRHAHCRQQQLCAVHCALCTRALSSFGSSSSSSSSRPAAGFISQQRHQQAGQQPGSPQDEESSIRSARPPPAAPPHKSLSHAPTIPSSVLLKPSKPPPPSPPTPLHTFAPDAWRGGEKLRALAAGGSAHRRRVCVEREPVLPWCEETCSLPLCACGVVADVPSDRRLRHHRPCARLQIHPNTHQTPDTNHAHACNPDGGQGGATVVQAQDGGGAWGATGGRPRWRTSSWRPRWGRGRPRRGRPRRRRRSWRRRPWGFACTAADGPEPDVQPAAALPAAGECLPRPRAPYPPPGCLVAVYTTQG
jgi:hypothetical protein